MMGFYFFLLLPSFEFYSYTRQTPTPRLILILCPYFNSLLKSINWTFEKKKKKYPKISLKLSKAVTVETPFSNYFEKKSC